MGGLTMDKVKLVDELFQGWEGKNSPGFAVSVGVDGEVIFAKGYGSANLEYDIPIVPSTIFNIASVSKQFTAFAILLLEQAGKLSLDDEIHQYVPELPDFGFPIKIEHLIHHTSGLRDHWELVALSGWGLDDVMTQERLRKITMRQRALNFQPASKYSYSNPGYLILGEIIKKLSGGTFPEFMENNIFKPLKMNNTYSLDEYDVIVKNRAYSYKKDGENGFKNMPCNSSAVGPGNLLTTVEDLAKWGDNFTSFKVGGKELIDRMLERYTLNNGETIPYACGVNVEEYKGIKIIHHGGTIAGFKSNILCLPEHNMTISLLSNLSSFQPAYYSYKLAEIFLDKEAFKENPKDNLYEDLRKELGGTEDLNGDDFVGHYLLDTKALSKIEVEDEKLFISLPSSIKSEMSFISKDLYLKEDSEILVSFKRDEEGNVSGLKLIYPSNKSTKADKILSMDLSEKSLESYIGSYYSQEIDTDYNIVRQRAFLVAKHTWKEDTRLIPCGEDIFVAETATDDNYLAGEISFIKNQGNEVMGFKLSGDRVKNLWFHKR